MAQETFCECMLTKVENNAVWITLQRFEFMLSKVENDTVFITL